MALQNAFDREHRIERDKDFDGDGRTDLLWQDPISGYAQIWFLGGSGQNLTIKGAANLTSRNVWRISGAADFNGDGRPDVVWQDPATGAVQIWFLGGAQGNVVTGAMNLAAGNSWRIAAVEDFDQDGRPDLVWQDPLSGQSQIWLLDGQRVDAIAALSGATTWRIVGPR